MSKTNKLPVVITTINSPTEAINKFDKCSYLKLCLIGDKKTPKDFLISNGTYLSYKDQLSLPFVSYQSLFKKKYWLFKNFFRKTTSYS